MIVSELGEKERETFEQVRILDYYFCFSLPIFFGTKYLSVFLTYINGKIVLRLTKAAVVMGLSNYSLHQGCLTIFREVSRR
jgi:hypothetical protein